MLSSELLEAATTATRALEHDRQATAQAIPALRRATRCWARDAGLDADTADDMTLAVDEAVTNVVEHAYPDRTGSVRVEFSVGPDGRVVVVVADDGAWRPVPAEPRWRGRGVLLIQRLADEASITPTPRGTTVRMAWFRR